MPLEGIDREFIDFYQTIGRIQGIQDTCLTSIMAILYLEPEEISMDKLAKKTGYSLASMSNKIKILEIVGFLKRVKKPGSKKIFLKTDKNLLNIWKKAVWAKHETVIRTSKEKIPKIIEKYKSRKLNEKQKQKFKLLENYYGQMMKIEKMLNEIIKIINKINKE